MGNLRNFRRRAWNAANNDVRDATPEIARVLSDATLDSEAAGRALVDVLSAAIERGEDVPSYVRTTLECAQQIGSVNSLKALCHIARSTYRVGERAVQEAS